MSDYPQPRVNAVLHPVEPTAWSLHRDVMAAAVGEPTKGYTIFVFFPAVMRTIGQHGVPANPGNMAALSRAMGRVVSHELVHVLAPERGHAPAGLMAPRLSRGLLLGGAIWLDGTSSRLVRVALSDVVRAERPQRERSTSDNPRALLPKEMFPASTCCGMTPIDCFPKPPSTA